MERLMEASRAGNIDGLYVALRENANVLAQIDGAPFVDTPLHAAASAGHIQYAMEIMRLMPLFATKSNQDGFCPIHLALRSGCIQLVIWLVERDSDLVRLKGREGITPLHYVAEQGNLDLLASFLLVCPKSIEDVTNRNETALHIALKNDKFEAFDFLVGRLHCHWVCHEEARYWEKRILNRKDETGNTVLHIATYKNQPQLVKLLISCIVDINEKNDEGLTALDYVRDESQAEIKDLLCSAGAVTASSVLTIDNYAPFLRTDQKLKMAAEVGDIQGLYSIINEDQYILERIDQLPFTDTPLHIAASKGRTQFALEIIRLKPSFAEKLNQDGFSPMHLALQNQSTFQTALRLADVNEQLICLKGRRGLTPLHFAAEKEELELLAGLLIACPKAIYVVTEHKETALHIAAKNDKVEALKVLFGWLEQYGKNKVLNWSDDEGNTVLHIASRRNQIEVVRLLIGDVICFPRVFLPIRKFLSVSIPEAKVDLNIKNSEGLTAVDILQQEAQLDIRIIQATRAHAKFYGLPYGPGATGAANYFRRKFSGTEKWFIGAYRENLLMPNGNRNAVLVVAVLIATATYQAVLSPPGGLWQPDPASFSSYSSPFHTTTNNTNINLFEPKPGSPALDDIWWALFAMLNSLAFFTSLEKINIIFPGGLYSILPLTLPFVLCYSLSMIFILPVTKLALIGTRLLALFIAMIYAHTYRSTIEGRCRTLVRFIPFVRLQLKNQDQTMQNET